MNGEISFVDWTPGSAFPVGADHQGMHAAVFDTDGDGDLDIFLGGNSGDHLFENVPPVEVNEGDLAEGQLPDLFNLDPVAVAGHGSVGDVDSYTVTGLASDSFVAVVLNGTDDYELSILDSGGSVVATSDRGGLGTEEAIQVTIPTGGAYTLRVTVLESAGSIYDIDSNGTVNVLDLIELLLCFGQSADPPCDPADVNLDGAVDVLDLIGLLLNWGPLAGNEGVNHHARVGRWLRMLSALYFVAVLFLLLEQLLPGPRSASAQTASAAGNGAAASAGLQPVLYLLLEAVLCIPWAYYKYSHKSPRDAGVLLVVLGFAGLIVGSAFPTLGLIVIGPSLLILGLGLFLIFTSTVPARTAADQDHTKVSTTIRVEDTAPASDPLPVQTSDDVKRRNDEYKRLIDTGQLPSLRPTVQRIISAVRRVRSFQAQEDELYLAIEEDPVISAKVVQRAKRADIPAPLDRKKKMDILYATQRCGPPLVLGIAIETDLVDKYTKGKIDPTAFDYGGFWKESTARATAARCITERTGRKEFSGDQAYMTGLFCQLGRLAFAEVYPVKYAGMIRDAGKEAERLRTLEFQEFFIDHNELAAEMLADWGLSDLIWKGVLYQDERDGDISSFASAEGILAATLRWSGMIWAIIGTKRGRGCVPKAIELANRLGVPVDQFETLLRETVHAWQGGRAIL